MRWILLAVLAIALPTAGAAPVPKHLMPKDEPYWPTAIGTKWEYAGGTRDFSEEITRSEPIKGGVRLTVRVRSLGEWDYTIDVSDGAVILWTTGSHPLNEQALRLPLKAGDSWAFACPIQKGLLCQGGKITVGENEDIVVPAGRFRTTKVVKTVTEVNGKPVPKACSYTYWYAKGVGVVRMDWDDGVRMLQSFTPGKK